MLLEGSLPEICLQKRKETDEAVRKRVHVLLQSSHALPEFFLNNILFLSTYTVSHYECRPLQRNLSLPTR